MKREEEEEIQETKGLLVEKYGKKLPDEEECTPQEKQQEPVGDIPEPARENAETRNREEGGINTGRKKHPGRRQSHEEGKQRTPTENRIGKSR